MSPPTNDNARGQAGEVGTAFQGGLQANHNPAVERAQGFPASLATLEPALAPVLAPLPHFIVHRNKMPVHYRTGAAIDPHDPANQTDAATAIVTAAAWGPEYGAGFALTVGGRVFCLDLDKCRVGDGWSAESLAIVARFPGAAVEVSRSGTGLHIWGTFRGPAPAHRCKARGMELYTERRFIALGLPGATGSAATDCTEALHAIVAELFTPETPVPGASTDWTDAPCDGWAGPADDDDLIRRMLAARPSAAASFGSRATLAQLWTADADALGRVYPNLQQTGPYDASSADAALASHLAFWTGRDCGRIRRIMDRSALKRDKWEREDYMRATIVGACSRVTSCYVERADVPAPVPAPAGNAAFRLMSDAEVCALPGMLWLIKNVLPTTGLAACYGASGVGKSFLIVDMLQHLGAGRPWFGYRVRACRCVYIALEGEAGVAGRVRAYRARHGGTSENVLYMVQPFSLLIDVTALADAIESAGGAGLIAIDTLNRAAPGIDENAAGDMGLLLSAAKGLQARFGGLVLLVHHTGKDPSKGLRGHSSLHAAIDSGIEVRREGDRRDWLVAKAKDGQDGAAHPFRLDVVELGTDEDGEPVTSCVVAAAEGGLEVRRAKLPAGGNQRIVWDALAELFRAAVFSPDAGAPGDLPPGRPHLRLEDAIEKTRSRLAVSPDRQTERCRQAITGLVTRGILTLRDGYLWTA